MAGNDTLDNNGGERAIALMQAAMSRPAGERAAFLEEVCAGDGALRAEVERRINWETRMGGFLTKPIVSRDQLARPFAAGDVLLQRFHILRVAGEGGMGIVYEAQDERLGHRVAVKCPHFEFRGRVSAEAVQSLRVAHPNVCRVFQIHTTDSPLGEVDFLAMEFIEGETLAARLERETAGWLYTANGKSYAHQLCDGLAAVHAEGVVHRDLKPTNVMLAQNATGGPRAVIMDFGLAQSADLFSSQLRGAPAYIAPELWRGEAATRRSDLYALATLLFEMAVGHPPFTEGTPWARRLRELPAADGLRGATKPALLRALNPDPARRFDSVDELAAAMWPGWNRRALLWGGVGLGVTAAAGNEAKKRFWPDSPIRLALDPPAIAAGNTSEAPLVRGFLQDLAFRLRTLRGARRALTVMIQGSAGATHRLETSAAGVFRIRLLEAASRGVLDSIEAPRTGALASRLFALQPVLVGRLIDALQLGTESPREAGLTAEVYPAYLEALRITREQYERVHEAVPLFEEVVRGAPQSAVAHAGLAEALLGARFTQGKPGLETPARLALERAEQLDPNLPQVHLVTGRLELVAGHYERSRTSYRRAAELLPNEPEVFISMAYPAYMSNRFGEAESALQRAIAINPAYYKPYIDAGFLAVNRRQFALAERHWREAIRLAPADHVASRLDLAWLLAYTGRDVEAESLLDEVATLQRGPAGLQLRGDLRARRGDLAGAIALYEQSIGPSAPDYRAWSHLGTYYAQAGRMDEAREAWRKGAAATEAKLSYNRRQPDALAVLALYHAKLGEAARVDALAEEAYLLTSKDQWTVCKWLVLAYGVLGRTRQALDILAGAPADLFTELAHSPDLAPDLRRQAVFRK